MKISRLALYCLVLGTTAVRGLRLRGGAVTASAIKRKDAAHLADEAFSSTRHDDVDRTIETLKHMAHRLAIRRADELDRRKRTGSIHSVVHGSRFADATRGRHPVSSNGTYALEPSAVSAFCEFHLGD